MYLREVWISSRGYEQQCKKTALVDVCCSWEVRGITSDVQRIGFLVYANIVHIHLSLKTRKMSDANICTDQVTTYREDDVGQIHGTEIVRHAQVSENILWSNASMSDDRTIKVTQYLPWVPAEQDELRSRSLYLLPCRLLSMSMKSYCPKSK